MAASGTEVMVNGTVDGIMIVWMTVMEVGKWMESVLTLMSTSPVILIH